MPCRNESKHLEDVIKRVPSFVDEIIVVSNKSTDDTVQIAENLGVRVYEDNRTIGKIGYGFAHMTGIHAAKCDIIVGADSDGTYPVEQLDVIIDNMIDNNLQFLSCNRHPMLNETNIPFMLRFGVWSLNMEVRLLYWHKMQDMLSGMWLIDSSIKDKLNLRMGDWNLSPEIKINAARHPEINFAEYHIEQHQRLGETHQNYWVTGLRHMWWIFINRFRITPKARRIFSAESKAECLKNTLRIISENESVNYIRSNSQSV